MLDLLPLIGAGALIVLGLFASGALMALALMAAAKTLGWLVTRPVLWYERRHQRG